MEDKRYELVEDDFIIYKGKKLYRIRALKEESRCYRYRITHRGDLGGYIEGYHNLSQKGTCWIFNNAKVYGNAKIEDDAVVTGGAEVYGNARVRDNAVISDSATEIYGNAIIDDNAKVSGDSKVYGNAKIENYAVVFSDSCVNSNAVVKGAAIVKGDSRISDNAAVVGVKINSVIDTALYCRVENSDICDNAEFRGQVNMTLRDKLSDNSIISR